MEVRASSSVQAFSGLMPLWDHPQGKAGAIDSCRGAAHHGKEEYDFPGLSRDDPAAYSLAGAPDERGVDLLPAGGSPRSGGLLPKPEELDGVSVAAASAYADVGWCDGSSTSLYGKRSVQYVA